MRRNARRKVEKENWWNNKKILTGGVTAAVVVFAFAIGISMYSGNDDNSVDVNRANSNQIISLVPDEENDINTESASSSIGNTVKETEANQNSINTTTQNTTTNTQTNNTTKATTKSNTTVENGTKSNTTSNTVATNSQPQEEKKEVSFTWPVEGELLKAFSVDSLLYSATLKEWVAHNGVDIRADKTSVVKAAADGTVKSIKNDPRYGLTVVIDHSDNYRTVYSNLLTAEFVVEGENVTQGQTIGTVGNTATFEIADDSHLHFEMLKDSEYIDPSLYLK